jgi:hypothetical protein
MESLALMVSIIFLSVLLSGPISLILHFYGFRVLSLFSSFICILLGLFWISVVPFPISIIGYLQLICGLFVITKKKP